MGLYTSTMPKEYSYITMFINSTNINEEDLNSLVDEIKVGVREFNADVRVYTSPVEGGS